MAYLNCHPLWLSNGSEFQNFYSVELNISESLSEELVLWAETYDSILNDEYPPDSKFSFEEDELKTGYSLAEKLKLEMKEDINITYYNIIKTYEVET